MCPVEEPVSAALNAQWQALMLDAVDSGMVLLDERAQVLLANHAARAECEAVHPLQLLRGKLHARRPEHPALLQQALAGARQGRRKLLALGEAGQPVDVAVIPLEGAGGRASLLLMGKRQVCAPLSVQGVADCHALTQAETRVRQQLGQGRQPREVARLHGVSLATVHSQIRSIRAKTGARNIRDLLRQVWMLPPMVGSPPTLP